MSNLHDRAKILEDLFFSQLDAQLLRQRRSDLEHTELIQQLQEHTKITDQQALEHLINLGVTLETYIAVQLIPLILVAWADGELDPEEQKTVLRAATQKGIAKGTPSYVILEHWLLRNPVGLKEAWMEFMKVYLPVASPTLRDQLRGDILQGSSEVAESAGGFFGSAFLSISKEEKDVIDELKALFNEI